MIAPPPVQPGRPPAPPPAPQPPRERSVSFFVAIFLGLLLLASGALNVVLFVFSVGGLAASGLGGDAYDDSTYERVSVAGDPKARIKILRVPVAGVIMEEAVPVLGAEGGTVSAVRRALKVAAKDSAIRGVLLAIDSPGGGVTASDQVYRLIREFRSDHPDKRVLASFGDIAASGGYYVAAAAERILARRTTLTGSIGVIMNSYNVAEAAKKLGIESVVIKSPHTPYKDMLSPFRPMTDEERRILTSIVEDMYQQFVTVVDEGRPNLDRAQVTALANGSVYGGGQALDNGLVDQLGDEDDALEWFRTTLELDSAELIEHRRRPSLRELLFGVRAPAPPSMAALAEKLLGASTGPRLLYYWPGAR